MLSIRQGLFLLLLTVSVFAVQIYTANLQSYYLVITAFLLAFVTIGDNYFARVTAIFGTGLLATLAVFVIASISHYFALVTITLTIITLLSVYIGSYYQRYFLTTFIINFSALLAYANAQAISISSLMFVIAAMFLVALLQLIYMPHFARNKIRSTMQRTLLNLETLTKSIFTALLEKDYPDNLYYFERIIHKEKITFLHSLDQLRLLIAKTTMSATDRDALSQWISSIEYIYSIILDCAQIRRRVSDHTIFSVGVKELKNIYHEIKKLLVAIETIVATKKDKPAEEMQTDLISLSIAIKHLEENYQNVMRVTAREPLVFILFISSLKILNEEFILLYNMGSSLRELLERL